MARYEAVSIYSMALRPNHIVDSTNVPHIPAQSKMHGDTLWEAVGEKWLAVTDVNGVAASGWVAIVHGSRTYCSLTEINPPVTETFPPRVGLTFDGVIIKWYVPE